MENQVSDRQPLKLLNALLDEADDAVVAFRPASSKIVYANAAFAHLTGVSHDQLHGKDFFFCLSFFAPLIPVVDLEGDQNAYHDQGDFSYGIEDVFRG